MGDDAAHTDAAPDATLASTRGARLLGCLALLALVALIYAPVRGHAFVGYDDPGYVTAEPHVLGGLSWDTVRWAFTQPHSANWHPLTSLSHALDVELFGLDAGAHHLVNVALHAANALLVFLLLLAMTGRLVPSLLAAALFAAHPLRVESVAWIAERKDVLSGFFALLTLGCWLRWTRRPTRARYALLALALALGLMAKPMLVSLPFVLLLLDAWPLQRWRPGDGQLGRRLVEKLPLLLLAAAACLATLWAQHSAHALRDATQLSFAARLEHAPLALLHYLRAAFVPTDLAVFVPHPAIADPEASRLLPALGATALLAVLGAALVLLARRTRLPVLWVGAAWFVGMLVPVLGLVQVGAQAWADRYAYLPLLGLSLTLVFGLDGLVRTRPALARALGTAGAAAVLACAVVAQRQVTVWRDSRTLFEHALEHTEGNWVAHASLGSLLASAGESEQAARHVRAALALQPGDLTSLVILGNLQMHAGRPREALTLFERVCALYPDAPSAHCNRGVALGALGRVDEAERAFRRALALRPGYPEALANLARMQPRPAAAR